jgi:hyperosmotically inducible protein
MRTANMLRHILAVSAVAVSVAACSAVSGRESAGEYVDDTTISAQVKAKLLNQTGIKVTEVNVETMQGVVQLSGFVDHDSDRAKADQIAWSVKGVKNVKDNIVVRSQGSS